jgi:DNA-binding MarR family transcriptional regulator
LIWTSPDSRMKYDTHIDKVVLSQISPGGAQLFTRKTSFNKLYNTVCQNYQRISRTTFSSHLKRLMDEGLIERRDPGIRGTAVYYYPTDYGKRYFRLFPSEEQDKKERFERVYQLLFFFVSKYHEEGITYRLDSEGQFENFLLRLKISKNDLIVDSIRHNNSGGAYPIEKKMYESKTITTFRPISGLNIWKEDHHQCTWFSLRAMTMGSSHEIRHKKTYKITHDDHGKIILRPIVKKEEAEDGQIRREKSEIGDFSYYYCKFPVGGISVSDIMDQGEFVFEHAGFTIEEIGRAVELLREEDILRPAKILFGEIRYSFNPAHEPLKELLKEYWRIPRHILAIMNRIWQNLRGPTPEERKWLELFHGEKVAGEMLRSAYYQRHSYQRIVKGSITLEKMLKTFTDMSKENRKKVIDNTTRQEKRKMIIQIQRDLGVFVSEAEYNIFLIRDFDNGLKENMKEIEEKYADVIRKYSFPLKGLLKIIYPEFIQQATREASIKSK